MTPQERLGQLRTRIDTGDAVAALAELRTARRAHQATEPAWREYTEELIETNLKLRRYKTALRHVHELQNSAELTGDYATLVTAAWMRGTAYFAMGNPDPGAVREAQETALRYLEQWQPSTPAERELYLNRKTALLRDRGLRMVHETGESVMSESDYQVAAASVRESMSQTSDEAIFLIGREVLFRVELAAHHTDEAEKLAEEILGDPRTATQMAQVKARYFIAQVKIQQGRDREAREMLEQLLRQRKLKINRHLRARIRGSLEKLTRR
jgi:hypothetical protein